MKSKYSIYIIVFMFFFVYMPPVISINIVHLLTVAAIFSLVFLYKLNDVKAIIGIVTKKLVIPMIFAMIYLLVVLLTNQVDIMGLYPYFVITIEIPICVVYLCSYFAKHKYNFYDVLNILLIAGFIQGTIALLCFFAPSFKEIIVSLMMKNIQSDYLTTSIVRYLVTIRLNGFSADLLYTMPIVQAILGMVSLYLALNKSYKYILFMPILLLSAIVNARNSFIVIMYGIVLLLLLNTRKSKTTVKVFITVAIILIIGPLVIQNLSNTSQENTKWLSDGIDEIIGFLQGNETGYFQTVTTSFIIFPKGISLIFGTGKNIFGLSSGFGSDIGYINDLWLGGVVFSLIIYVSYISYYIKAYKRDEKLTMFISLILISTFFIMNIKGTIVAKNEFINVSVLLSTVCILYKKYSLFEPIKGKSEIE